jgi:hypothetical protein
MKKIIEWMNNKTEMPNWLIFVTLVWIPFVSLYLLADCL